MKWRRGRGDADEAEAGADEAVEGATPDADVVLYRCRTPTDVLCPCGAVARRLRKLAVPYRVERVPYRRAERPEIIELTGQKRVPLLIDGREVVHDSRRILEYLEWRYGAEGDEDSNRAPAEPA